MKALMMKTRMAMWAAAMVAAAGLAAQAQAQAQTEERVFEMRIYKSTPGNLDALVARFRNHTIGLFEKHGMTNIGYWVPTDEEGAQDTLIYLLSHASEEAALAAWRAFASDPEWRQVNEETTRDGPIVQSVERTFLTATDFSAIR